MTNNPIKYREWIASRREFMFRIGWTTEELSDTMFISEYRAMLIALKKDCTVNGMALALCSTAPTIMKDRQRLGLLAKTRGGSNVNIRLYSYKNRLMSCQQVAEMEGVSYNTAYGRLNKGGWAE